MDGLFILAMTHIGKQLICTIGYILNSVMLTGHLTGMDIALQATNNLEWYDPEAVTTVNGALQITLSQKQTHNLNYEGGKKHYFIDTFHSLLTADS